MDIYSILVVGFTGFSPSSPLDSKGNTEINEDPYKSAVTYVKPNHACWFTVGTKSPGSNDIVDKIVDGHGTVDIWVIPGRAASEGVEKGIDDPGDQVAQVLVSALSFAPRQPCQSPSPQPLLGYIRLQRVSRRML
jgi:hypothetical protein